MPLVPNWFIKGLVVCSTVCDKMYLKYPLHWNYSQYQGAGLVPRVHHWVWAYNVYQWCLQLVYHSPGGMNCLWFYATKYPLELFARAVDCLPVPVLFVSVVDIHLDSICDQRRRK